MNLVPAPGGRAGDGAAGGTAMPKELAAWGAGSWEWQPDMLLLLLLQFLVEPCNSVDTDLYPQISTSLDINVVSV